MFPHWHRKVVRFLKQQPIVVRTILRCDRISIWYATGFRRNYIIKTPRRKRIYARTITKADALLTSPIKIGYQYQWNILDRPDLKPFFFINRKRINNSSFIEQEILVHELLDRILKQGYIPCYYDDQAIADDLAAVSKIQNVYFNGIYTIYPSYTIPRGVPRPGQAITEKYFNVRHIRKHSDDPQSTLAYAYSNRILIYAALQKLIKEGRRDISIWSLNRVLSLRGFGPTIINPAVYKILFTHLFKPRGRIISDAHPNLGSKAIAASLVGAKYAPLTDELDTAIEHGFGGIAEIVRPPDKHDILIYDNKFKAVNIAEAMSFRANCNEMMLYVDKTQYDEILSKGKPSRIVKVKVVAVTPKIFQPDHIFIYRQ